MLFRGGLRDADVLLAEIDAVGLGVEDILDTSSCEMSNIFSSDLTSAICSRARSSDILISSNVYHVKSIAVRSWFPSYVRSSVRVCVCVCV